MTMNKTINSKRFKSILMAVRIFLTGRPGSGKSTIVKRVVDKLREQGIKVGGILTPEVRKGIVRVGFEVVDLQTGEKGTLATTERKTNVRFGKYFIDLDDFERIAIKALTTATEECDVVVIDEIGKMEMFSKAFKERLNQILNSDKNVLAVVHRDLAKFYKNHGEVIWVEKKEMNNIVAYVIQKLLLSLRVKQ